MSRNNSQHSSSTPIHATRHRLVPAAIGAVLIAFAHGASGQAPAGPVTGGDTPGSFKLPGSDTSVRIGGFLKLDAVFSSRSAGVNNQGDQLLTPQTIPVGPGAGDNERRQLTLHARESRLNVGTSTPTKHGPLVTFVEGDFFGSPGNESVSNSNDFRLRHAYGSLGGLLAGQTWTTFMHVPGLPETVNFGGTVGEIFVRQAMVRWTQKVGAGDWAVALENPEAVVALPGTATTFRADDDRFPDIAGRVTFGAGAAKLWAGALVRNIRVDSAAAPASDDDKWGAALSVAGVVPVFERDDFRFLAYGGNSIGRYNTPGFYVDGVVDSGGQLSLPKVFGGFVAYRHFWTSELRSSFVLGGSRADNPSGTFGAINKSDRSAHVNLFWSPWKTVNLGAEYIHARREIESGQSGSLNRVQLSAQYSF
jgi:hypothetical protein